MSDFAIIETGGKQYKVSPGKKIKVEKLDAKEGDEIKFDKVLLVKNNEEVKIGAPYLADKIVTAKLIKNARSRKVIVFKFHPKTRYKKTKGHRQHYSEVEIVNC